MLAVYQCGRGSEPMIVVGKDFAGGRLEHFDPYFKCFLCCANGDASMIASKRIFLDKIFALVAVNAAARPVRMAIEFGDR